MNTRLGCLKRASRSCSAAITDASDNPALPSSTTTATTPSPKSGCGTPITADSRTPGSSSICDSISFGYTLKPPEMIRSLARPTMVTRPSPAITAMSPVMNQPSGRNSSAVFSGICQ